MFSKVISTSFVALAPIWVVLAPSRVSFGAEGLQEPSWLAFGDFRGYIEPCGCDPATDLGGVGRLTTLLTRERRLQSNALIFNLGNNLGTGTTATDQLKNKYLTKAMVAIKPTASIPGVGELADLPSQKRLNWVLSNAKAGSALQKLTKRSIEAGTKEKVLVFGFVSPNIDKKNQQLLPANHELLESWRKLAANTKKPQPYKILLFSGDDSELRTLQLANFFDLIVSSNRAQPDAVIDNAENINPEKLLRAASDRPVRMVPLGGQGVLRGGVLAKTRALSISEIMESPANCSTTGLFEQGKGRCTAAPESTNANWVAVSWLDKSLDTDARTNAVLREYNIAVQKQYARQQNAKLADVASSQFVGAAACASCHAESYKVWENSNHAHAFATLEAKNKAADSSCVGCHVVGFAEKGGFVSMQHTKHLKDVQCESCHGPRLEHTKDPSATTAKAPDAKAACVSCHQGMHSPNFDYAKYWEQIKHK